MPAVELVAHKSEWAVEFAELRRELESALGEVALRIDHIGSTSVPGLIAKDVIDLQVIVERHRSLEGRLPTGFESRFDDAVVRDHVPAGWEGHEDAWDKRLYVRRGEGRPVNLHVRLAGSPNERYALLFRDFLRADDAARDRWAAVKARAAAGTDSRQRYADAKDPLTDPLLAEAEAWARATGWSVPTV